MINIIAKICDDSSCSILTFLQSFLLCFPNTSHTSQQYVKYGCISALYTERSVSLSAKSFKCRRAEILARGGSRIFRTSVKIFLVDGAGRGLEWTWSTPGGEGALNNFYADSPPLNFYNFPYVKFDLPPPPF